MAIVNKLKFSRKIRYDTIEEERICERDEF